MRVLVVNQDGSPLSPCHPARARMLLKQSKAQVECKYPFTIRLTYQVQEPHVAQLEVGVDDGGKKAGIAVVLKRSKKPHVVVFQGMVKFREDISERITTRANHRRQRRNRSLYRQPRFDNRRRSEGWLPPSVQAKKEAIVRAVKDIGRSCELGKITLEDVKVDIQKLKDPKIYGAGYQAGFSKDYHNLRYAILHRDEYTCQHCGAMNTRLEVHHIIFKEYGGTDQPENLMTLCETCHANVHKGTIVLPRPSSPVLNLRYPTRAMQGKRQLSKMLQEIAPVERMYGYETASYRMEQDVSKSDWNDAVMLAVRDESFIPGGQVFMLEPLQRRKRKCWDKERIKNTAIVQYRNGGRLRRKVLTRNDSMPEGTVKHIQHRDTVRVIKSGKVYVGQMCGIKTRGELKVRLARGEVVDNCGINKLQLLNRPRNLAYIPLHVAEQQSAEKNR